MKILFCPTHYIFDDGDRGSELSWAYEVADGITRRYDGSVVVAGSKNVKEKKMYEIVELQKNKKDIDLGFLNALFFNILYSRYAYFHLKKERFDVLHHILPFGIDTTFNLSFIFGNRDVKKIIGPIQNPLPLYRDNIHDAKAVTKSTAGILINRVILSLFYVPLKWLSQKTLRCADKVIVINGLTRKMLVDRGIDSQNVIIIPPGIDCKKFIPSEEKRSSGKIEILSVGALIERKGFDLIIKVVKEVMKSFPSVIFRIVGDGPKREFLENRVLEFSLENNIIFEGLVKHNEMKAYYKNADIFVSMSRSESWGQMYLEAMACGLPIITTKNVGSNEIIKNGEFGYLVEQEDYMALADKIRYLIEHRELIEAFGKRARKEAEEKYDWEKVIIPQYREVYKDLL